MLVKNERWVDEVVGQRMIATFGVMALTPHPKVLISNLPNEDILPDSEISDEMLKYAYSYTEKIVLFEKDGVMWGFVPSTFPSSSLMIILKFHIPPKLVLALIKEVFP